MDKQLRVQFLLWSESERQAYNSPILHSRHHKFELAPDIDKERFNELFRAVIDLLEEFEEVSKEKC